MYVYIPVVMYNFCLAKNNDIRMLLYSYKSIILIPLEENQVQQEFFPEQLARETLSAPDDLSLP